MEHVQLVSLFISTFLLALITGFFYAYSCSVNIGLGRMRDISASLIALGLLLSVIVLG